MAGQRKCRMDFSKQHEAWLLRLPVRVTDDALSIQQQKASALSWQPNLFGDRMQRPPAPDARRILFTLIATIIVSPLISTGCRKAEVLVDVEYRAVTKGHASFKGVR